MKRVGRFALFAGMALALTGLFWIGGELHRENCLHENRAGCSVLPWGNGHDKRGGWGSAANTDGQPTLREMLGH